MSDDAQRHREKMAKRKAVQDAEVAGKTLEKGLLIVHSALGVFGESVLFALPFLVVICLWFLMARHPNARN